MTLKTLILKILLLTVLLYVGGTVITVWSLAHVNDGSCSADSKLC